jgi:hypothetical protein
VEGERQLALELEHRDVAGRLRVIAEELGAGYARGVDAERGSVEGKRPLKIATASVTTLMRALTRPAIPSSRS